MEAETKTKTDAISMKEKAILMEGRHCVDNFNDQFNPESPLYHGGVGTQVPLFGVKIPDSMADGAFPKDENFYKKEEIQKMENIEYSKLREEANSLKEHRRLWNELLTVLNTRKL